MSIPKKELEKVVGSIIGKSGNLMSAYTVEKLVDEISMRVSVVKGFEGTDIQNELRDTAVRKMESAIDTLRGLKRTL